LRSGPNDPRLTVLPLDGISLELEHPWMLRLADVPRALAARGYAPGARGELELDVSDDLLASNAGRFVLSVAGGEGTVRRGGSGVLRVDVRGLAALYTGHLGPWALRAAGLADGDDAALEQAAALFDGPAPWMVDWF
jgi:predicted acetyltransferase